jgi:tRNA threonylcarbamoyladenosine biosynthesis protein TsaE
MKQRYFINDISKLKIPINIPSIIFLKWDLWSWKTTISKHILNNLLWIKEEVKSPTYVYYNKYWDHYHFDLYRLKNYDEFFAIWWEEILDNNTWIILIEWPEILEKYVKPNLIISLKKTENEEEREIMING